MLGRHVVGDPTVIAVALAELAKAQAIRRRELEPFSA
jgi:hypothetical protein